MTFKPAISPEHGSMVITREGLIGQAVGVPKPEGLIPVIPKYVPCRGESPWVKSGLSLCRVLQDYGPRGIGETLKALGFAETLDGLYNSPMPYVREIDTVSVVAPREALERVLRGPLSPLSYEVLKVLSTLRSFKVKLENLGLTGSIALSFENPKISDVDLVAYGFETAELLYGAFLSLRVKPLISSKLGGLKVSPELDVSWRRADIGGVHVTWVGVPLEGELCKPLKEYFKVRGPVMEARVTVSIEGGQESSLLYPPCASSLEGVHVVSFEYNVAAVLYEGGVFSVYGLVDREGSTVYIATRQLPGSILRLKGDV